MAASDPFYNSLVSTVETLLAKYGATYTIRSKGVTDPVTLQTSSGATRSCVGVVSDSSMGSNLAGQLGSILSSSVENTSLRSLLLPASASIQAGEEIQVDGQWFDLKRAKPLKPADVTLMYTLELSR
ncbi:head-closure protein [Alteromonas phage vB_AcoS-R7M]|uniref:Head-closure protein n=1 Tax=Alteromonas phage vB_AcoS-R7M TaxID=2729541 RepID=A0A6M3YN70_9CAUD|nr:head-closure protein [Alteromonas phage vB_AcoS-R7M]QJI53352.1 head-closure protein [Alteromonas phage vB_AcoS-R7M]